MGRINVSGGGGYNQGDYIEGEALFPKIPPIRVGTNEPFYHITRNENTHPNWNFYLLPNHQTLTSATKISKVNFSGQTVIEINLTKTGFNFQRFMGSHDGNIIVLIYQKVDHQYTSNRWYVRVRLSDGVVLSEGDCSPGEVSSSSQGLSKDGNLMVFGNTGGTTNKWNVVKNLTTGVNVVSGTAEFTAESVSYLGVEYFGGVLYTIIGIASGRIQFHQNATTRRAMDSNIGFMPNGIYFLDNPSGNDFYCASSDLQQGRPYAWVSQSTITAYYTTSASIGYYNFRGMYGVRIANISGYSLSAYQFLRFDLFTKADIVEDPLAIIHNNASAGYRGYLFSDDNNHYISGGVTNVGGAYAKRFEITKKKGA